MEVGFSPATALRTCIRVAAIRRRGGYRASAVAVANLDPMRPGGPAGLASASLNAGRHFRLSQRSSGHCTNLLRPALSAQGWNIRLIREQLAAVSAA
jgi:hypothetical protein